MKIICSSNYFKLEANFGFTLSEVIITVAIIGFVAALVISPIVSYVNDQVVISKVKKYYSVLTSATQRWENENSCLGDSTKCLKMQYSAYNCKDAFSGIASNLKIVDARYQNNTDKNGKPKSIESISWLPISSYTYDARISWARLQGVNKIGADTCNYLLDDGVVMSVFLDYSVQVPNANRGSNLTIFIDVNGKKLPNRVGKDQFPFSIGYYTVFHKKYLSLHPYYSDANGSRAAGLCNADYTICNDSDGYSPTAYLLKYDKLPDLTKLGFSEKP